MNTVSNTYNILLDKSVNLLGLLKGENEPFFSFRGIKN